MIMPDKKPKQHSLLIVEDEPVARERLVAHLENEGSHCRSAGSVAETLQALKEYKPDLVLLDIQLPDAADFMLARKIRQQTSCGLIIVTGLSDREHCLQGLQAGADDYIVKPYDMQTLLVKVHNLLQRLNKDYQTPQREAQCIHFNEWTYQPTQFKLVNKNGLELKVTKAEHDLLMVFLNRPNRVICREEIITVLEDDTLYDRAIDSRVSRLKKKIEIDVDNKNPIQSIYGCGYVFNADVVVEQK